MAKLPAIVLAGATAEPEMKEKYSVAYRAELPISGKMMVQHVVDALKASSHVGNIHVVGDVKCDGADGFVPPASTLIENLIAGMKASGSNCGLIVTSDIPLVTPEAIDDFIERCGDLSADLYYSIIPKEACDERFPGVRRTYVRLAEGTFTGGNIMVMSSRLVTENADIIREVVAARKSPMKLARLVGIGTLLRVIIAQTMWAKAVNLPALEKTAGRILKANIKAVQTPYAEIGTDVDDAEQLEAMERLIEDCRRETGD